jgi:hypothetical protein
MDLLGHRGEMLAGVASFQLLAVSSVNLWSSMPLSLESQGSCIANARLQGVQVICEDGQISFSLLRISYGHFLRMITSIHVKDKKYSDKVFCESGTAPIVC